MLESFLSLAVGGLVIASVVGFLALWVWSFLHCLKRNFRPADKAMWLITITFGYIFGASVYLFLVIAENREKNYSLRANVRNAV